MNTDSDERPASPDYATDRAACPYELGAGDCDGPHAQEGPYRVDVTDDLRTWASNGIEYGTPEDAREAADKLVSAWLSARAYRIVPVSTPRGEAVVQGSWDWPA